MFPTMNLLQVVGLLLWLSVIGIGFLMLLYVCLKRKPSTTWCFLPFVGGVLAYELYLPGSGDPSSTFPSLIGPYLIGIPLLLTVLSYGIALVRLHGRSRAIPRPEPSHREEAEAPE